MSESLGREELKGGPLRGQILGLTIFPTYRRPEAGASARAQGQASGLAVGREAGPPATCRKYCESQYLAP